MSAKKLRSQDLTHGSITKQLVVFALPILLGQIFQNLYNSVDAIVVGQFLGTDALAAVSCSADLSFLLVGFFTGLSTGAGVLFARYFGAKDYKNLHGAIHTAFTFSLILGIVLAITGILLTPQLLRIVSCPEEVFDQACSYLRVYFVGTLFTSLYNIGSGVLRAVGNSRDPFIYLVISSVTNIVLDLLFVAVIPMGVLGAALATVISQLLSVCLTFGNMMRTDDVYKFVPRDLHINKKLMLEIVDLGFPAGVQMAVISIANLFIQRFINMAGVAAMSGIGAAKKIDKFAGMVSHSFGLATSTFVGQNMGAKNPQRAFKGIRNSLLMAGAFSLSASVVLYVYADFFISLFTSDADTIRHGVDMLHTMMPLYLAQVLYAIFSNAVRGFGKSRAVMVYALVGMVGVRQVFLHIAMAINGSVRNIYYAYPLGWACAAIMCIAHYYFTVLRPYYKERAAKL